MINAKTKRGRSVQIGKAIGARLTQEEIRIDRVHDFARDIGGEYPEVKAVLDRLIEREKIQVARGRAPSGFTSSGTRGRTLGTSSWAMKRSSRVWQKGAHHRQRWKWRKKKMRRQKKKRRLRKARLK